MNQPTFRTGTTSYIIPADITPNARFLADKVRDIELVLFEVDDGQNNLPDPAALDELARLAAEHDLTYTVHLPLDLRLGADGDEQHVSLVKARKVIDHVRRLDPWAYVLHLDGREVRHPDPQPEALQAWTGQAVRALDLVAEWAGGPDRLAVENLEGYPLDFWEEIFSRNPAGRCVDVGHLWLDGHDPVAYLDRALPRTKVIHAHGIGSRDHQSLNLVPQESLREVLRCLRDHAYQGVFTLEVFGEDDFTSSMAALQAAWKDL
jgi:sugar phosphate isomerase/epimerase